MRDQVKQRLQLFTQVFGQLICLYPKNLGKDAIEDFGNMRRMFATRTDHDALSKDWYNVGRYIQTGMDRVKNV